MDAGEYIGLDVGVKRTGIARASTIARLAEPLQTVETAKLIDKLKDLMKDQPIKAIVVGLPRGLNGQETDQTAWVRQWAMQAKKQLNTAFYWQDEALTTTLAASRRPDSVNLDAEAAAIILQDYLDDQN